MKTWVYVDGFNLCYRALKDTPYKWLDLSALCASVLPKPLYADKIPYFTARVTGAVDSGAPGRRQVYLNALGTLPAVEIHYGHFLSKSSWRPLMNLHAAGAA